MRAFQQSTFARATAQACVLGTLYELEDEGYLDLDEISARFYMDGLARLGARMAGKGL